MFIYARYNKKAGAYMDPYLQPIAKDMYPGLARRSVILNPDAAKADHLFECDLYYFGTFDEVSGKYEILDKPEFLCTFADLEVKTDA